MSLTAPAPYYADEQVTLLLGGVLDRLADIPDGSIDAYLDLTVAGLAQGVLL